MKRSLLILLLAAVPMFPVWSDPTDDAIFDELLGQEAVPTTTTGTPIGPLETIPSEPRAATIGQPIATQKGIKESVQSAAPETSRLGKGVQNEITQVEFKMDGDHSQIILSSRAPLEYRTVKTYGARQLVYVFEKTKIEHRLQRAYDTTEFASPVAMFTVLQMDRKKDAATKLIIQLREDKAPAVRIEGGHLVMDFSPMDGDYAQRGLASQDGILSDTNIYSGDRVFTGQPIRLEVKNSDVQDVLRLIAKSSGYNIVTGEEVQGKVGSISFDNIPWDQAFALVLQSKKLGFVRQGNVLRVGSLSALKTEKDEVAQHEAAMVQAEPLKTVLIPISYAKASDLAPRAAPFITKGRGSVDVDSRSNTIIIRDVDAVVTRLQKLFNVLDTQPPLVSVSAKIIEATTSVTRSLGMSLFQLSSSTSGLDFGVPSTEGYNARGLIFQPSQGAINIRASSFADLDARIRIHETENELTVLANPTISVQQNEKGSISAGYTSFITTPGGINTAGTVSSTSSTLSLDVTPTVSGDGSISLSVTLINQIPKNDASGTTTAQDTRNITTQVLLQDGDTAVLGGVFNNRDGKALAGIPFLRNLPLLGFLFSSNTKTNDRSEILVFLTARVLNPDESFKRNL